MTPEQRADAREYFRIYAEGRRRRAGCPRRYPIDESMPMTGTRDVVSLEPVKSWLFAQIDMLGMREFSKRTGLSEASVLRWKRGEYKNVRFVAIDHVLTRLGRPDLLQLLMEG